jgi:hypothetical protein
MVSNQNWLNPLNLKVKHFYSLRLHTSFLTILKPRTERQSISIYLQLPEDPLNVSA